MITLTSSDDSFLFELNHPKTEGTGDLTEPREMVLGK